MKRFVCIATILTGLLLVAAAPCLAQIGGWEPDKGDAFCIDETIDPDHWNSFGDPAELSARVGDEFSFTVTNRPKSGCLWNAVRVRSVQVTAGVGRIETEWSTNGGVTHFTWTVTDEALRREVAGIRIYYEYYASQQWQPLGSGREWKAEITTPNGQVGPDIAILDLYSEYDPLDFDLYVYYRFANVGNQPVPDGPRMEVLHFFDGDYYLAGLCYRSYLNDEEGCDGFEKYLNIRGHLNGPKTYHLRASIDTLEGETGETADNNSAWIEIEIPKPGPELEMYLWDTTRVATVGEPIVIRPGVANVSKKRSSPAVEVVLDARGWGEDWEAVTPTGLDARESHTFEIEWTPEVVGAAELIFTADPDDLIYEIADETVNNTAVLYVDVRDVDPPPPPPPPPPPEEPNLVVTPAGISMTPASPIEGETLDFTITVHNVGEPTVDPVKVNVEGGTTVAQYDCGPISDVPCTKHHAVEAVAGTQTLTVIADPGNDVDESNEDDNQRTLTYNVPGGGTTLTCQGAWTLTGIGNEFEYVAPGSVVDDCEVYWAENTPDEVCWQTRGISGWSAEWFRDGGSACPTRVLAHTPEGDWEYDIVIE